MEKKKTFVEDIDRKAYDISNADEDSYRITRGLTADIVEEISSFKKEPAWMLDLRLDSLKSYHAMDMPTWGPSLHELDMDNIITYVRPNTAMKTSWEEVPMEIKATFERLGIPQAEHKSLAGVGAQYDSEVVYHSIKDGLLREGVVYLDMETAVKEYEPMIREHFMKLLPAKTHKFLALHGAVWSGGSFVYVPKGVDVKIPLQSYFRFNAPGAGQFEHTLIIVDKGAKLHFIEGCSAPRYNTINLHAGAVELYVREGATLRYSTIENWSKNMLNLNTKKALVDKNANMEWISGTFGSHITMLYPASILTGEGAKTDFTGVSFAANGQNLDTGMKVVHAAPYTSSTINSRSISKDGGIAVYRSAVNVLPEAHHIKSAVSCESLMMDSQSRADTLPVMDIRNDEVDIGHEAKIGRISEDAIFYLMTRGLGEAEAKALIVRGFVEPITKELPLEYAVEMNNL
jgi:Fe-S cluster assembly protein SufB